MSNRLNPPKRSFSLKRPKLGCKAVHFTSLESAKRKYIRFAFTVPSHLSRGGCDILCGAHKPRTIFRKTNKAVFCFFFKCQLQFIKAERCFFFDDFSTTNDKSNTSEVQRRQHELMLNTKVKGMNRNLSFIKKVLKCEGPLHEAGFLSPFCTAF